MNLAIYPIDFLLALREELVHYGVDLGQVNVSVVFDDTTMWQVLVISTIEDRYVVYPHRDGSVSFSTVAQDVVNIPEVIALGIFRSFYGTRGATR